MMQYAYRIFLFDWRGNVGYIRRIMAAEELRGPALYEALMALKPVDLSEYEWAEKAGLNRGWFNDIKKAPDASPRTSNINKALAAIGLSLVDLYGGGRRGNGGLQQVGQLAEPLAAETDLAELIGKLPAQTDV